jgi:hypothetical protein
MSKGFTAHFLKFADEINIKLTKAVEVVHTIMKKEKHTFKDVEIIKENITIIDQFFSFAAGIQEMKRLTGPFIYTLPDVYQDSLKQTFFLNLQDHIDYKTPPTEEEKERVKKRYE